MKTTLVVLLLVCSGCSVTPTGKLNGLYGDHARCLEAGAAGCESIWEEIEQRERIAASRERLRECPNGTASVRDSHGPATCVSHAEVRTFLSQRLR